VTNRVLLPRPLTGDAGEDAHLVVQAIRAGRIYSVIDAISPDVVMGLTQDSKFIAVSPLPRDARVVQTGNSARPRSEITAANSPGRPPVPWVVANWAGPRPPGPAAERIPDVLPLPWLPLAGSSDWRVEKDPLSSATVTESGGVIALDFRLRDGQRESQFVAAAADVNQVPPFTRIGFRGRADRPMRVSFQPRLLPDDARWITSVYLEPAAREVVVDVKSLKPADGAPAPAPDTFQARSILFVVDLVNARPGDAGTFTIDQLRVLR
jgi:hypothetical protein